MLQQAARALATSPPAPMRRAQQIASPTTPLPADQHPVAVYLGRLSPGSRRAQRSALDVIASELADGSTAETLPWWDLRYQHTRAVRALLAERYAPSTANRHIAALRGVLHECWRRGRMDADAYHRAIDIAPVRGETLPAGRALSSGALRTLFEHIAATPGPGARRDAALLATLYGGGLRRAEAVTLHLSDLDPETSALTVRRGKGSKPRVVYATNGGRDALDAWITVRGPEPGPLFLPGDKGGTVARRRMSVDAIYDVLHRRAPKAGGAGRRASVSRRTMNGHS